MDDHFVEAVLIAVEQIPSGQVASYGDLAELVGRGGPRQVGQVMARYGAAVGWWRVVHADGSLVAGLEEQATVELRREKTPMRGDRVDMRRARFTPPRPSTGGFPSARDL